MLWCWSPDAEPGNINACYPGDEYVDVAGLDAYSSNLPEIALDDYREMIKYGKTFGFSEYGCASGSRTQNNTSFYYSNFLNWLKNDFPEAFYFLIIMER